MANYIKIYFLTNIVQLRVLASIFIIFALNFYVSQNSLALCCAGESNMENEQTVQTQTPSKLSASNDFFTILWSVGFLSALLFLIFYFGGFDSGDFFFNEPGAPIPLSRATPLTQMEQANVNIISSFLGDRELIVQQQQQIAQLIIERDQALANSNPNIHATVTRLTNRIMNDQSIINRLRHDRNVLAWGGLGWLGFSLPFMNACFTFFFDYWNVGPFEIIYRLHSEPYAFVTDVFLLATVYFANKYL